MELNFTNIIDTWVNINTDLEPVCFYEAVKQYSLSAPPDLWKRLFFDHCEQQKFVALYLKAGGTVLDSRRSVSSKEAVGSRIRSILRNDTTSEHQILVSFMAKLYEHQISRDESFSVFMGTKSAALYDMLRKSNSNWNLPIASDIINLNLESLGKKAESQMYLKKALLYLDMAKNNMTFDEEIQKFEGLVHSYLKST